MRRILLICLFTVLLVCALMAQTNTGSITGVIHDPQNAVIAGAIVTVVNADNGQTARAVTSDAGVFTISALQPGVYNVSVGAAGFAKNTFAVQVHTAATASADAVLTVSGTKSEVIVEGGADTIAPESASINTAVEGKFLEDIPVPERSSLGVVMLAPGVQGDPQYSGGVQSENPGIMTQPVTPGGSLQMGGGRPGSGSILVDGSDISLTAYPRTGVTFSSSTIQEVVVQQNGLPAQYGRTGGGIVNQSTRSGGNVFHGSGSWQHSDPTLEANPWGNPNPSMKHLNMFAGMFGGPVVIPKVYNGRNKTFFYVTVEPLRMSDQSWSRVVLPTTDELAGKFHNSLGLLNQNIVRTQGYAAALAAARSGSLWYQFLLDANGIPMKDGARLGSSQAAFAAVCAGAFTSNALAPVGQPCPTNAAINGADDLAFALSHNPVAQFVFGLLPSPNRPSNYYHYYRPDASFDNDGTNGYGARGVTNVDNRYSFRIDHALTPTDQLRARYTTVPVAGYRYNSLGPESPADEVGSDTINSRNATVSLSHFFPSGKVNEFRAVFIRGNRYKGPVGAALSQDWAVAMGLSTTPYTRAVSGVGFPTLQNLTSGWGIGSGGTTADAGLSIDQNFGLADDFSFVHGAHTIRVGAETRMMQLNRNDNSYLNGGQYNFNLNGTSNGSTGGLAMASFVLGQVNSYTTKAVPMTFYYRWKYYAGYVQDDWKVRPNLTLNVGLRYSLEMPRKEKYNHQGSFDPNVEGTLNGLPVTGGFTYSGQNGRAETLWPANYLGFEPRIGLAWAPFSSVAVRASYSLVHAPLTGLGNNVLPDLSLNGTPVSGNGGGLNTATGMYINYITNPIRTPDAVAPIPTEGPLFVWNSSGNIPYIDQSNAVPYVQLWSFSTQFQVTKNTVIEIGYSGQKGTHLFGVPVDKNAPTLSALMGMAAQHANFNSATSNINPYGLNTNGQESLLQALRPYQQFYNNPITSAYDRTADSSYNSFYVSGRGRISKIVSMMGSFTWSKSIDDASSGSTDFNSTDSFGFAHPQLPYSDYLSALERSYSTFDIPMRGTLGYSVDIPVGRKHKLNLGNSLLNGMFGEWSTNGLMTIQSGTPLPLVIAASQSANGWFCSTAAPTVAAPNPTPCGLGFYLEDAYVRPDILPGVSLMNTNWRKDPFNTSGGGGYLNPDAFAVPGSLGNPQVGNAPRTVGSLRNPSIFYFDMGLNKEIPTRSERFRLVFSVNASNVFNHANFLMSKNGKLLFAPLNATPTVPGQYFTPTAAFGTLQQAGTSRVLRLGIKASF